jgi:hypothetical protein
MAGEDFYLLNKMVKVAPLIPLTTGRMVIRGRESDRVPFGTGAALSQMCNGQRRGEPYRVYDPCVFEALGRWHRALHQFAEAPDTTDLRASLMTPNLLGQTLVTALDRMGAFDAASSAAQQTRKGDTLRRRLFEWSDAFRTLKLVHALRETFESLPLGEAIQSAPFLPDDLPTDLRELRTALSAQTDLLRGHAMGLDVLRRMD